MLSFILSEPRTSAQGDWERGGLSTLETGKDAQCLSVGSLGRTPHTRQVRAGSPQRRRTNEHSGHRRGSSGSRLLPVARGDFRSFVRGGVAGAGGARWLYLKEVTPTEKPGHGHSALGEAKPPYLIPTKTLLIVGQVRFQDYREGKEKPPSERHGLCGDAASETVHVRLDRR